MSGAKASATARLIASASETLTHLQLCISLSGCQCGVWPLLLSCDTDTSPSHLCCTVISLQGEGSRSCQEVLWFVTALPLGFHCTSTLGQAAPASNAT